MYDSSCGQSYKASTIVNYESWLENCLEYNSRRVIYYIIGFIILPTGVVIFYRWAFIRFTTGLPVWPDNGMESHGSYLLKSYVLN